MAIEAHMTPLSGSVRAEVSPASAIDDITDDARPFAGSQVPQSELQALVPRGQRPALKPFTPEEGVLSTSADMADLLAEAFRQQVTGRIDFSSGTRQKSVVFERGHPVDAYSSQVYDRMEEYLAREGRITRAQYHEVRVKGLRGPRRIGAYLVNEGYLRPD